MIGNDIVDLAKAKKESNWQRKGFLDKLFTEKEQELILTSDNPEQMVWHLWSRKEAAYKIYNRQTGERFFNPKCFVCEADEVVFGHYKYYTQTQITPDFIYTIAVTSRDKFESIQHLESRDAVQKKNGIPHWFDIVEGKLHPASITHHGRFARIAYLESTEKQFSVL
ncbi:4'-phosphopantetheinyl transferase superfamily protein [Flavobacterium buctense]|uniref:4'-phosphopantetheinyl transferase superfamily protein n=1 Tax=Flavobacterium buctense TaxID=1648146 RepID=A0ABU9E3V1_9FLAO|nr:4'-phosphopantetheinyl transferase superfamily protein [Flavobacterium buctense]